MKKFLAISVASFVALCTTSAQNISVNAQAHVIVYKTRSAYKNLVPVQLSVDRKSVVSYPAPSDVETGSNGFPLPIALHGGYWLDRVGVSKNTAYIKLTYTQYRKLKTAPSADELNNMIVDRAPIKEIYDCGIKSSKNTIAQLNTLIDKKQLKVKCRKLP